VEAGVNPPVVTDGPFQEFKEWLAGFQIIDVESEERAIEIAAKLSAVPGPRRCRDAAHPGAPGSQPNDEPHRAALPGEAGRTPPKER
jgi:hypothetical protein